MPEMPEVETMVDRLQRWVGWEVGDVAVDPRLTPNAAKKFMPHGEREMSIGQRIQGVYRRGKFIIFATQHGALLCHNAMSGYWDSSLEPWTFDYVEGKREPSGDDVRVEFGLRKGLDAWTLNYHDARMFGSLHFVLPDLLAAKLSGLGPEADSTTHLYEPNTVMEPKQFAAIMESKQPVKSVLMDQAKIAGIGNIYASEACWLARVDPRRPAKELSRGEADLLLVSVKSVLRQALDRKLDYAGLQVYRRSTCPSCGGVITREEIKGRSTFFCPSCQK